MQADPGVALRGWPRCIHLAGADGTGKSTQARALFTLLQSQGIPARYVWLRFPRLFCVPFLAYARLRGYSWQETVDGHRHGYWDFSTSWLMSKVFPWALLLDTLVISMIKIHLPLKQGYTLVCDRFALDILADLMTGLDNPRFDEEVPGRLFLALLPPDTRAVVLDLETKVAKQRCPELLGDRSHSSRRAIYLEIARRRQLPVISTEKSTVETTARLVEVIECRKSSERMGPNLCSGNVK